MYFNRPTTKKAPADVVQGAFFTHIDPQTSFTVELSAACL